MIFGISGRPNILSVIERCPYYRGVRKERLDCIYSVLHQKYSFPEEFSTPKETRR